MKIIVGLGNPGRQYAATRHNLGFMVVDDVAGRLGGGERRSRFKAELVEARDGGEKIVLIKPQTFMNLSGTSVREAVRWYKASLDELLVVLDDIDLPYGAIRMRPDGGSGGHNGLKSIIADLGSQEFARLRLGIGRGAGGASGQVLSRFHPDEERQLPEIIEAGANCALDWARYGAIAAMNRCNRKPAIAAEEPTVSAN